MCWCTVLTLPDSSWVHQSSVHIVFSKSFQLFLFPTPLQYQKVNLRQWAEIIHITESQNNSFWKGYKNVSSPERCLMLKAVSFAIRLGCSELYPSMSWKISKDGNFTTSLGSLPVFGCSQSGRVSPYLQPEPLLFHLRPDASCIVPHAAVWIASVCSVTSLQPLRLLLAESPLWSQLAGKSQIPQPLPRGQGLQFPLTILMALHWTHCSLWRSLLKWESNILCSFLDMV